MNLGLGGIRLARHGQTNDNLEPYRFQGWTDTPLNDTGRRQAHELADRVSADGIASLWASDLSRARETAEIGRPQRGNPVAGHLLGQLVRLATAGVVERGVGPALEAEGRKVVVGLAVASQPDSAQAEVHG